MMDKLFKSMKDSRKPMKKLSENEMKAKMEVIKDLQKMAMEEMTGNLKGMHSAKIMSDSPEGLKKGAELLSDKLEQSGIDGEEELDEESEEELEGIDMPSEGFEGEVKDYAALNEEQLDSEIEKLMKLKDKMKAKSFGIK